MTSQDKALEASTAYRRASLLVGQVVRWYCTSPDNPTVYVLCRAEEAISHGGRWDHIVIRPLSGGEPFKVGRSHLAIEPEPVTEPSVEAIPTKAQRDEWRRLADAATPGPWTAKHRHALRTPEDDESCGLGLEIEGPPEAWNRGQFERGADARFIAAAREAVPALLDALESGLREATPTPEPERDYPCAKCGGLAACWCDQAPAPLSADQVREIARATLDDWIQGPSISASQMVTEMDATVDRVVSRFTATKETGK